MLVRNACVQDGLGSKSRHIEMKIYDSTPPIPPAFAASKGKHCCPRRLSFTLVRKQSRQIAFVVNLQMLDARSD